MKHVEQLIGNCVVNGNYEIQKFTIKWVKHDGTTEVSKKENIEYGTAFSTSWAPAGPTWDEFHTFSSWGTINPPTAINSSNKVVGNGTFTAQYTEKKVWMTAIRPSGSSSGSMPVYYSVDNGATWSTGMSLYGRSCIGFSPKNNRFIIGTDQYKPNNSNNYGLPWFNYDAYTFDNFTCGDYASTSEPIYRTEDHTHVCISGGPDGLWILGTGTDPKSGGYSNIYYSTDNGVTWNKNNTYTAGWVGYFTQAAVKDTTCVVVGNCPEWHVSTNSGKTWVDLANSASTGYQSGNRRCLVKTHDRFIACGAASGVGRYSSSIDYLMFNNTSTLKTVGGMTDTSGNTVSLNEVCWDSAHNVLIGIDWKRHIYRLSKSNLEANNFTKWERVSDSVIDGSTYLPHPSTTTDWSDIVQGPKYGNGVAMIISYRGSSGNYVLTSSDGGVSWKLTSTIKTSTQSWVKDFICSE